MAAGAAFGSFGFLVFFVAGREGMSGSDARSIGPISDAARSKSIAASYFEQTAESFNRLIALHDPPSAGNKAANEEPAINPGLDLRESDLTCLTRSA
jgi:hypothetical protein